jgi:hyaluronoglucosaminidase
MHNRLLQQLTLATSLLLTGFMPAEAQIAPLSPVPQIVQWGDPAFANTTAFTLQGEATADANAVAALKNNLKITSSGMPILIGEVGDDAVKAYEASVPTQAEGYYLSVATDKVIIAGRDSVGTFYGVQTFLQMMKEPSVMAVTIKDYPSVSARGVVEGFYGNPWSQTDRKRQFEFYGANKLNTYIYGPKDDVYHRAQWKVNYPQAEANKLKELVETANHNKVRFVWAIHPGNSISWNDSDNDGIVDDFVAVKNKLQSVYDLGVREFAVFFDDISGVGKDAANQAKLINYLDSTLRKVHPDIKPFILCPTEYNKAYTGANDTYLTTLGTDMVSSACIMWTGNSVVDMINKSDMEWINTRIKRNAYIWLNYPVTDYCTNHMLMGPTYGNDTNISSMCLQRTTASITASPRWSLPTTTASSPHVTCAMAATATSATIRLILPCAAAPTTAKHGATSASSLRATAKAMPPSASATPPSSRPRADASSV